jgi:lysophospholipase L1-like esterase
MKTGQAFYLSSVAAVLLLLFSSAAKTVDQNALEYIDVICFGDSITSGYKLPDPARQSYPARLEKLSEAKWKVRNLGVPGATTLKKGDLPIWQQQQYQTVMSSSPDAIIMIFGTNDTKDINWQKIDNFEADYLELVKRLKDLPSAPKVYIGSLPHVLQSYPSGVSNQRLSILSEKVKKIAQQTGVHYIDITTPLGTNKELFIDDLHPNPRGEEIIARTVLENITAVD